jgi:hypothetical protein
MSANLPETLEARWAARTVPMEDGHLGWTGSRWLKFHGELLRPARIAFTMRTGRQPQGRVAPDCGMRGCVAPTHVEDQPGRQRNRAQLRAIKGLPERQTHCARGHDQTIHGRLDSQGRAYCNPCVSTYRNNQTAAKREVVA